VALALDHFPLLQDVGEHVFLLFLVREPDLLLVVVDVVLDFFLLLLAVLVSLFTLVIALLLFLLPGFLFFLILLSLFLLLVKLLLLLRPLFEKCSLISRLLLSLSTHVQLAVLI
jgi:hypothetical protein